MTPDDEWPRDEDVRDIIARNTAVRIPLTDGEGASCRFAGFGDRADWLDIQVGRRNWTWTPGGEKLAVVYHVPEHIAILFKLTWGGL
jgi:hypothetical protein